MPPLDPARGNESGRAADDGRVTGEDLRRFQRCPRELYLARHAPDEMAPPSPFQQLLMERGQRHEREVVGSFGPVRGPLWRWGGDTPLTEAAAETRRLLRETRAALYQPVLLSPDGRRLGVPDLIYWEDDAPVVHDVKLALRVEGHPEIALQLSHYGRLLEEVTGIPPRRLEITNGAGAVVGVPPLGREALDAAEAGALATLGDASEPDVLQARSTCVECGFFDHCWTRAIADRRIEILPEVRPAVARELRARGVAIVEDLAAREPDEVRVPGVGEAGAVAMIAEARAHRDRRPVWLRRPRLPAGRPRVWFDLESDPQAEDGEAPIYLWGLAVDDGDGEPVPEAVVADLTRDDDRGAWSRFVARAGEILDRHPQAVWVHYASFEKTAVRRYARLHPTPRGFLERMEGALWDLYHGGVRPALRLPVTSYSIKQVAPFMGFAWHDPESGSEWSVAQVRQARAADDPEERRRILDRIVAYNADDLMAMRAVWRWIEAHAPDA